MRIKEKPKTIDSPQKPNRTKWVPNYRSLTIKERDLLYALYEKWNGRMTELVLDKDCSFKSYSQINYYCRFYHFKERLVQSRLKRNEDILSKLHDAKMLAIENAMRILESHHVFVKTKQGVQLFDKENKPLIVEQLPFYKEIKVAWEIIKTELNEPTSISKGDLTSGGKPITGNIISFENYDEK